jgi:hypothetical protein
MGRYAPVLGYFGARAHLWALLRLGVAQVIDVRDPIQFCDTRGLPPLLKDGHCFKLTASHRDR